MKKRTRKRKEKESAKVIDHTAFKTAEDFYEAVGQKDFIVSFTKADNIERVMRASCNLQKYNPHFVISKKGDNLKSTNASVMCIDSGEMSGWRFIKLPKILELKILNA